jgi:ubiquinol-cytochrome c reductase cytochrome c subunit
MTKTLVTVVVALSLPGAGAAQPGGGTSVEKGKELYAEHCLSCHGPGGSGVTSTSQPAGALGVHGLGPPLRGVGALAADFYLTTGYMPLQNPHDQPRHTQSPFDKQEIASLVAYVASLGKGSPIPKPEPKRSEISRGLQLFTEHCAGCHQVVAEGGYVPNAVAPPLHQATALQIAEAVRVGPYLMPKFGKSQITDGELNAIVAYVEWTKHPDDRGGWNLGRIGPVPEGLVTWLMAAVVLIGVCLAIGRRAHT